MIEVTELQIEQAKSEMALHSYTALVGPNPRSFFNTMYLPGVPGLRLNIEITDDVKAIIDDYLAKDNNWQRYVTIKDKFNPSKTMELTDEQATWVAKKWKAEREISEKLDAALELIDDAEKLMNEFDICAQFGFLSGYEYSSKTQCWSEM